jgi:predicted polyphosphate/ATP-dependent NAD kinase
LQSKSFSDYIFCFYHQKHIWGHDPQLLNPAFVAMIDKEKEEVVSSLFINHI